MSWPASSQVALDGGVDAALGRIPTDAGVGQLLGDEDRSLTIGRPADLRRWFASQLGRATVKKGQRPPTDLTAVARTMRFWPASTSFQQRLTFERLMSRHVPASARRDLKTPAYLHVDPTQRFPRVTIHTGGSGRADLFGPFRDRRAADRAREGLQKLLPLRPCDYTFEPAPELALGLSCLYAQVKTCAAPCLSRVSEDHYRGLARDAVELLDHPSRRAVNAPTWLPAYVASAAARAVIAERGPRGLELYPVVAGAVHEDAMVVAEGDDVAAALSSLTWPSAPSASDVPAGRDEAWLTSWLLERRRRGVYAVIEGGDVSIAAQACAAAQ